MADINADFEWVRNQDLKQFRGKWIAVSNKKILFSGKYADEVAKKVKDLKITPFLVKVPHEVFLF